MFRLEANIYYKEFVCSDNRSQIFKDPLIFYHLRKSVIRRFWVLFTIIDFKKGRIIYIDTYTDKNINLINKQNNDEIYSINRSVHCTLNINDNVDFLTFMEEESFFFYVNYREGFIDIYTMNDLVKNKAIIFNKISSTFYKDPENSNYFYMSAVSNDNWIYLYRVSLDLKEITEIDRFESNHWPPHVIRKYKNHIFISHEFKYSSYQSEIIDKLIMPQELNAIMLKKHMRYQYEEDNKCKSKILYDLKYKDKITCVQGKILMLDAQTQKKSYFETSGGSPAHFEIDDKNDFLYTSSHNFIIFQNSVIFFEPAVIDKYKINQESLEHLGKFLIPEGYRYTTHKIFYNNGRPYLCTIAEPNRLLFISAETMELTYSCDIGENILDKHEDIMLYINGEDKKFSYIALEVSYDGETILFIDAKYLYFFSFSEKKIYARIEYGVQDNKQIDFKEYLIWTAHFNFLE